MPRVQTYNIDGSLGPEAELRQDDQAQLWLDNEPVVAVSLWGQKVALTLTTRLVLLDIQDYGKSTKYGNLGDASVDEVDA